MNDGFLRCAHLFLYKLFSSAITYLICTVLICIYLKSNLHGGLIGAMTGAVAGAFSSVVFILPFQHMHIYKASRLFSITSKNYHLSSYVTNIILSLFSMAMMWIILDFTNIFKFTPLIAVIVFFLLISLGLVSEFCGLMIYKGNLIIGFAVSFSIYIACVCVPIALIFSNNSILINTYLIAICIISIALAASFFIINTLIVRNLELQN